MTRNTYIFMDFDGVTHPWGEVEDFRCLPLIEAVLREFEEARVVIASDWRMLFSMQKLLTRFAEDIRPRIAGATPHMLPKSGTELHGLREREAMLWLAQHEADHRSAAWCALDDAPGNWMTRSRLLLTDSPKRTPRRCIACCGTSAREPPRVSVFALARLHRCHCGRRAASPERRRGLPWPACNWPDLIRALSLCTMGAHFCRW